MSRQGPSSSTPHMKRSETTKKRPLEMEEAAPTRKMILKILGPDGALVSFKVPRDMPLQKLLKRYCEDKNLEYLAMDFTYDGQRVYVRRTPDELHMMDEDQIDAFVRVGGGGRWTMI